MMSADPVEIMARILFDAQRAFFKLSPINDRSWKREYHRDPLLKIRGQVAIRSVIENETIREHVKKICG